MKTVFEIETGNRAFEADHFGLAGQTSTILATFANRLRGLDDAAVDGFTHPLHDDLGNVVGHATVER
jgi:hypothetical protein